MTSCPVIAGGLEPCFDQGVNPRGSLTDFLELRQLGLPGFPVLVALPDGLDTFLVIEDFRQHGHDAAANVPAPRE